MIKEAKQYVLNPNEKDICTTTLLINVDREGKLKRETKKFKIEKISKPKVFSMKTSNIF